MKGVHRMCEIEKTITMISEMRNLLTTVHDFLCDPTEENQEIIIYRVDKLDEFFYELDTFVYDNLKEEIA